MNDLIPIERTLRGFFVGGALGFIAWIVILKSVLS
jgi:hypothetical protein